MRGKIIEFRRYHDLSRVRLYRQQAVPRGPAAQARLDRQIARISGLLGELEELTRGAGDLPPEMLVQARATTETASRFLRPQPDDPQPEVDRGLLDRMYRALELQAAAALPGSASPGDRASLDGSSPATERDRRD
jgi:hypothetical protein